MVRDPQIIEFESRLFAIVLEIFEAAAARGQLEKSWTARSGALVVYSLFRGLVSSWARGGPDVRLMPEGIDVVKQVLQTLKAPSPHADARPARARRPLDSTTAPGRAKRRVPS